DDGSSDDTYEIAQRFAQRRGDVVLLRHERNRGLGAALRTAFANASGIYLVTIDSDLSYSPEVVVEMLETIERQDADIVLASAYMPGGSVAHVPWARRVLSREANRFLSLATNARIHTLTCMVRAYRASSARQLASEADGMEVNPELLFSALRSGARVVEIPARLSWSPGRAQGVSRLNLRRVGSNCLGVLRCGLSYRPALLLAIPGLTPGIAPVVMGVMFLFHASLKAIVIAGIIIETIQLVSLAILAGQVATFFGRVIITWRRQAARLTRS
ncbi:MAG: glycosyltransferase family 2 protein, partial [bacterium]|nr:glycosyltransferase family 2 protein [bacterium]